MATTEYKPRPLPSDLARLPAYVQDELRRLSNGLRLPAPAEPSSTDDQLYVEEFGAVGNSAGTGSGSADTAADDTPAFQRAVDRAVELDRPCVIRMGSKGYKLTGPINLSEVSNPLTFQGAGINQTSLHPTPFGASKSLFYATHGNDASGLAFKDFRVSRTVLNRSHPVAFYLPDIERVQFENVRVSALGNTAIIAARVFNSEWRNVQLISCGTQPLRFSIPSGVSFSTSEGSDIVTASEPFFDAAHEGEVFYIRQTTVNDDMSQTALVATISTVLSTTTAQLDRPCYWNASGAEASFDGVRADVSGSSITFSTPCLESADDGRWLYIDGAGPGGGVLQARVSVLTSDSGTLSQPAEEDVTNARVWFTPSIVIDESIRSDFESGATNDLAFWDLHIETPRGPGVVCLEGTNIFWHQFKYHGRIFNTNDFAAASHALILSRTNRTYVNGAELEFGAHGLDSGHIVLCGDRAALDITGVAISAPTHGAYFIDYRVQERPRSWLLIGSVAGTIDWNRMAGLVNTHGAANPSVHRYGPVVGYRPGAGIGE